MSATSPDVGKERRRKKEKSNPREQSHLDGLVPQLEEELDPPVKLLEGFSRRVDVAGLFAPHLTLLVVDASDDNAVPDRLGDDVLGVFFRVQREFLRNVRERDARVRERDRPERRLDHVVSEAGNQRQETVSLELVRVSRQGRIERLDRTRSHGWVRKKR